MEDVVILYRPHPVDHLVSSHPIADGNHIFSIEFSKGSTRFLASGMLLSCRWINYCSVYRPQVCGTCEKPTYHKSPRSKREKLREFFFWIRPTLTSSSTNRPSEHFAAFIIIVRFYPISQQSKRERKKDNYVYWCDDIDLTTDGSMLSLLRM